MDSSNFSIEDAYKQFSLELLKNENTFNLEKLHNQIKCQFEEIEKYLKYNSSNQKNLYSFAKTQNTSIADKFNDNVNETSALKILIGNSLIQNVKLHLDTNVQADAETQKACQRIFAVAWTKVKEIKIKQYAIFEKIISGNCSEKTVKEDLNNLIKLYTIPSAGEIAAKQVSEFEAFLEEVRILNFLVNEVFQKRFLSSEYLQLESCGNTFDPSPNPLIKKYSEQFKNRTVLKKTWYQPLSTALKISVFILIFAVFAKMVYWRNASTGGY